VRHWRIQSAADAEHADQKAGIDCDDGAQIVESDTNSRRSL
jgi:hypothetical protein